MSGITATDTAISHIQKYISLRGAGEGIRLAVRTSGCSGMAYVIEYIDGVEAEDNVYTYDNIKIAVDPKSLEYLDGMVVDYVKEGLNEGFKFRNPNVSSECGCGESFNV